MSRSVTGTQVAITFRRGNSYVVFKANLLYGLVNYSVSDYSVPTTTVHPPTTTVHPPTTTVHPPTTQPPSTTTTTTLAPFPTPPPCVTGCDDD